MATEENNPQDNKAATFEEEQDEDKVRKEKGNLRIEIDTSAPFESVKEAASRFGGMGFWRPTSAHLSHNKPNHNHHLLSISDSASLQHGSQTMDIAELEEQAAQLERDLIMKERETLDVLKELETTKMVVEELKANLQKEASEVSATLEDENVRPVEASAIDSCAGDASSCGFHLCPSSAPGYILLELKQAKLNLTRTTDSLADIRSTVESYNKKIEKERISLEKTRQRLSSSALKISSLETELSQTKDKLELIKSADSKTSCDGTVDLAKELKRLSSETEEFKKVGEAARAEVLRAMSEIELAKTRIKTAEIRLVAAKKMKEAARAAEAAALAEIKAMSHSENSSRGLLQQEPEVLTISFQEYSCLMSRAREAEAGCQSKLTSAMDQVEEANLSKAEILRKVEEAREEVQSSKKALEEALSRVENANRGKLAVEEALRKWRAERGKKRRPAHSCTKFKNAAYPSHLRKDASHLHDVNGARVVNDDVLKPAAKMTTMSIGQILSRKLLLTEEFENGMMQRDKNRSEKRKVSLGQMLGKQHGGGTPGGGGGGGGDGEEENAKQQLPAKRKKFGFGRISSVLVTKHSKKKKKHSGISSRCASLMSGNTEI